MNALLLPSGSTFADTYVNEDPHAGTVGGDRP